jgi:hypothetical protein
VNEEALAHWGLSRQKDTNIKFSFDMRKAVSGTWVEKLFTVFGS